MEETKDDDCEQSAKDLKDHDSFVMPFVEILNAIPRDMIKNNIIEQLTFQSRNQIMCPKKQIDESNYTSVYYDGQTLCYHLTVPKGYIRYLDNMDENDKKEICESIEFNLKKYSVTTVKFVKVGFYDIHSLNLWIIDQSQDQN